jgi:predicted acylesterase/phospholipase RssA
MHKIGIVFSGGIAKGAYQIGFCKAFESLIPKDKIVAISGSSIGAWNAAMLLHSSTKSAEEAWINIDIKGLRQVIKILFSRLFLYKQLDNCVDLSVLYSSKIDFFVTCMELPWRLNI